MRVVSAIPADRPVTIEFTGAERSMLYDLANVLNAALLKCTKGNFSHSHSQLAVFLSDIYDTLNEAS
jgi:hypothetical protein